MKLYRNHQLTEWQRADLCLREPVSESLLAICREIFAAVESEGDRALRRFSRKFDGVDPERLRVDPGEPRNAFEALPAATARAFEVAAENIRRFHQQQGRLEEQADASSEVRLWRETRPIDTVGLYVPAGTALLPSTALMLGIPAQLAGCRRRVLCAAPDASGKVPGVLLAAAYIAGIQEIYSVGGAQAIAAMALGTKSVPRVDKIFGPGNRYVQAAKLLAFWRGVEIDMVAGPSELLVLCDLSANPEWMATDLLAQAEHGAESQVVLVSPCEQTLRATLGELDRQLLDLPRKDLAKAALDNSFALLVADLEEGIEFSNRYAPEHLILHLQEPLNWVERIQAAGSVFLGPWSPEAVGDYASGANHTLPTGGRARATSGLGLESFQKRISFQDLSSAGLLGLSETVIEMAEVEGLRAHARSVVVRREALLAANSEVAP